MGEGATFDPKEKLAHIFLPWLVPSPSFTYWSNGIERKQRKRELEEEE